MRLFELEGQYTNELLDTVIDLIYTASAEGQDSISTEDMISDLESQGYLVNVKDLIDMLQDNPIIINISKDSIDIDTGINDSDSDTYTQQDQEQRNQDTVSAMAKKQINKDI